MVYNIYIYDIIYIYIYLICIADPINPNTFLSIDDCYKIRRDLS